MRLGRDLEVRNMAAAIGTLLGVGIYSVPDASRLTGVSPQRIRRWLRGYTFVSCGSRHTSPPVWQPELPEIDDRLALGFRDLMEVRFVDAFIQRGVTWQTLRRAAEKAQQMFGCTHPFSMQRFRTDGHAVFVELVQQAGDDPVLVDLARNQLVFRQVLASHLYRGLEFSEEDAVIRWWPLPRSRRVVIDPQRSFGQPIVTREGVPTAVLACAVATEDSVDKVASWFEVETASVRAAVQFEEKLAA